MDSIVIYEKEVSEEIAARFMMNLEDYCNSTCNMRYYLWDKADFKFNWIFFKNQLKLTIISRITKEEYNIWFGGINEMSGNEVFYYRIGCSKEFDELVKFIVNTHKLPSTVVPDLKKLLRNGHLRKFNGIHYNILAEKLKILKLI